MQVFEAQALRHPAEVGAMQGRSFVPNNICLGGSSPGFVLLTGPNMGGKSTLLRQVSTLAMWLSLTIGQLRMQASCNHAAQCAVALHHPSPCKDCLEACCQLAFRDQSYWDAIKPDCKAGPAASYLDI